MSGDWNNQETVIQPRRGDLLTERPGRRRDKRSFGAGVMLAIAVHAGLIAAIAFGVHWRSREPESKPAELWAAVPQAAAPRGDAVQPPTPAPAPAPVPAPVPAPAPVPQVAVPAPPPRPASPPPPPAPKPPPPAPPPKVAAPPPVPRAAVDAQIAIEQARQREAAARKAETEREEAARERSDALRKKQLADKKDAERREAEKQQLAEKKKEADKRLVEHKEAERVLVEKQQRAEKAAAEKQQQLADKREAEQRREAAAQKQRQAQDDVRIASLRNANLKRMLGQAGSDNGSSSNAGRAARDSGPSPGYHGRIVARIRPNIVYPRDIGEGNMMAEVKIDVAPDGTITGTRLTNPSGNASWDEAVLRAIAKAGQLPLDVDGRPPPSQMTITFRSRD